MNTKDIDIYLTAKKQQDKRTAATIFSIIILTLYLILSLFGVNYSYFEPIAVGSFIGAILLNSDIKISSQKFITRNELLRIIENTINNDDEALEYISNIKK